MLKKIFILSFVIGIILFGINIIGFFLPLRSDDVYKLNSSFRPQGIHLTEQQVLDIVENTSIERKQYLINVNNAVNDGVAYYWGNKYCSINGTLQACNDYEGIDKYHLRIPVYKNYILYSMSYIFPQYYLRTFYGDYRKGLERGVGVCDQQTVILDGLLESQNIECKMIDTPHHFFETALADPTSDEWWILDPSYGVVVPYNIQQIQENPELIRTFYLEKGYSNETIDALIQNVFTNHTIKFHSNISEYSTKLYPFNKLSRILIWLIPICMILPLIIIAVRDLLRKNKNEY